MSEVVPGDVLPPKRKKGIYVGAPACFLLELACQPINTAFGGYGCFLVGSALERPDWRDIDVRFIMSDEEFAREFPAVNMEAGGSWEFDPKWILLTTGIAAYLSKASGLPVDFQFQPQSHANERHKGPRNALGLHFAPPEPPVSKEM
jgi:hypothetical protein